MKRFSITFIILSAFAAALCSCTKYNAIDEFILAPGHKSEYVITSEATRFSVSFGCSGTWSANVADGSCWIDVNPKSGDPGKGSFTISLEKNESQEARDSRIAVSYGNSIKYFSIHQEGRSRQKYAYTGNELIEPFTLAYDYFLEEDFMPESIDVQGDVLNKGQYYELMCLLLNDISKGGNEWRTKIYSNPMYIDPDPIESSTYDSYDKDTIDLSEIISYNERQIRFASNNGGSFSHACSDGNISFSFNRSVVVTARALYYCFKNEELPEQVSSWQSDFLSDLNYYSSQIEDAYCSMKDPLLIETRDKIIAGKKTSLEKAIALFEFARDEWEWESYDNSKRGASAVIICKSGNSCDLTHGLIALARATGIPARYVYAPATVYPSGNVWGNIWAEIYVDGVWYICDTSNNGCTFDNPLWLRERTIVRGKYKDLLF